MSMASSQHSRPPLMDVSKRVNSAPIASSPKPNKTCGDDHLKENAPYYAGNPSSPPKSATVSARSSVPANARLSAVSEEGSYVHAQVSTAQAAKRSKPALKDVVKEPKIRSYVGPWQLGKSLGAGSSARVRLARHRVTHQSVAVKIMSRKQVQLSSSGSIARLDELEMKQGPGPDGVKRMPLALEREIAILALMDHPNIMKLYDIWETDSEIYLMLEYVEHGDLFHYINRVGHMSEPDAAYIFRQLMSALEYCQEFNICHRDLKPENILLTEDGHVKVCDFGLAALHQNPQDKLRSGCGSPHYAAPELLRRRQYRGDKADNWSMGVILFAMVAGRLPFDQSNTDEMMWHAKRAAYEMPDFFSLELQDFISRILQVNPDKRMSIREMWQHPFITRYDNHPSFQNQRVQAANVRKNKRFDAIDPEDLNPDVFRQLHAMWHALSDKELTAKLIGKEPNDQKMFYHLISSIRGKAGVRANTRYKRGVDFSRVRQRSVDPQPNAPPTISEQSLTPLESVSGDEALLNIEDESPLSGESLEEPQQDHGVSLDARSLSSFFKDVEESSLFQGDDWIHFSNSIARDCDAAFNSSICASPSVNFEAGQREASPFSLEFRPPSVVHQTPEVTPAPPSVTSTATTGPWDLRPLPPPPPQSESVLRDIVEAQSTRNRKSYNSSFDDAATLVVPGLNITKSDMPASLSVPPKPKDYRVVSAPAYAQYGRDSRQLPSIYKSNEGSTPQARAVSAPQHRASAPLPTPHDNRGLEYLAKAERTIRVVHSPSAPKTVGNPVVPEPLNVRKKLSRGYTDPYGDVVRGIDLRQQFARHSQLQDLPEEPTVSSHSNGSSIGQKKKKLSSWFRRTSKDDVKEGMARNSSRQSQHSGATYPKRMESTSTNPPPPILEPTKKKSLIFSLFKATKSEPRPEHEEPAKVEPLTRYSSRSTQIYGRRNTDMAERQIEPQQNWLARLFRVKPATRTLCLAISRRRARQEATILLREWRKWGMRDVEVDKDRNIIFARVGKKNYLKIKEVSFALEIMTVIEHGKRNQLSIIRFTQEKGAASSFHKVVDTTASVFANRGLLVADKRKAKMMVRTLDS
ncbi:putative camk camkl gin4 protein kinase protein [Phaeoacremonium minimum UCRPA7]|uniref:non-specific serine/threonine protein kinase n=1 Tax=Phaeoacremonium minimum (strain UCR-PA7) TaxID=1286976 RepID=R8BIB6_PHAM7|nr:putative camk camkl gin4 protein kinase protein [Phaeoacremonium minimum UCRPA7]EON99073.1 putative camk camkl gin4 protein kinase protein [Phaeoacremonium minimum UCRPA7]